MGTCLWLKGFGGVGAYAVQPGHRRMGGAVVGRLREFCGLWRNGEPSHGLEERMHRASSIKRANTAHTQQHTAP